MYWHSIERCLATTLRINHSKVIQLFPKRVISSTQVFRNVLDKKEEQSVPKDKPFGEEVQRMVNYYKDNAFNDWRAGQKPVMKAMAVLEKACARVNRAHDYIWDERFDHINQVCDKVMADQIDVLKECPQMEWEIEYQFNTEISHEPVTYGDLIRPIVRKYDRFSRKVRVYDRVSTALNIALAVHIYGLLLPALNHLLRALRAKEEEFATIINSGGKNIPDSGLVMDCITKRYQKIVRHKMPFIFKYPKYGLSLSLTPGDLVGLGQSSFSSYAIHVDNEIKTIRSKLEPMIYCLNLYCNEKWLEECLPDVVKHVSDITGLPFVLELNAMEVFDSKYREQTVLDILEVWAESLKDIANDIVYLSTANLHDHVSAIGYFQVNSTRKIVGSFDIEQIGAMNMVCHHLKTNRNIIPGLDHYMKPNIKFNVLPYISLIADATHSFADNFIARLEPQKLFECWKVK